MLEIREVSKTYDGPEGQVAALDGVSLLVRCGEFIAVQGASGSGKTTLLLAAGGLLEPDNGQVVIDGADPYKLNPNDRARLRAGRIGFVFQRFHLVGYLSVLENVLAPSMASPGANAAHRARELIERFNLTDRMHHVPAELSVGERQRAALARALLNHPKILLADEPTGNLDEENSEIVMQSIAEFAKTGGAVLLVTHDADAAQHAGKILQMRAGKFV